MATSPVTVVRERRVKVYDEMNDLAVRAATENRPLTAEEESRYGAMSAELEVLDKRIDEMFKGEERARALEERLQAVGAPHRAAQAQLRSPRVQDDDVEDGLRRIIFDRSPKPVDVWPTRRGYSQPGLEQRAILKSTPSQALPTGVYDRVVQTMVENSAVLSAGATVINTENGNALEVPFNTSFSGAALTAEGAAIAETDPALNFSTLGAYKYAILFQVSRELAQDDQSDILGFLAGQAGIALALKYGVDLITGAGTAGPQGIVTAAGVGVTGPVGTSTSPGAQGTANMGTDILYNLIGSVAEPYARQSSAGFIGTNATLQAFRKLKDTAGQPVASATMSGGSSGIVAGMPKANELAGYSYHIDPFVAQMGISAKSLIFGDISRYFVRIAGPVRFERSDDYAFNADLATFRGIIRLDGRLVDIPGIKVFANSAT
jgi:HK97 family phage major capsid protein